MRDVGFNNEAHIRDNRKRKKWKVEKSREIEGRNEVRIVDETISNGRLVPAIFVKISEKWKKIDRFARGNIKSWTGPTWVCGRKEKEGKETGDGKDK